MFLISHDRWPKQTGSWYEYNIRICNVFVELSTQSCCLHSPYITKKRMSSCPNVSSVNVSTVCLSKLSTWFMHKSAARWSQVVPWCIASGDLATRAVPLRWRIEPVTTKQIWNRATLCHKFLHSTEVTWKQREPFFAHLWAKTLKRWASLAGREQGGEERECGCKPLQLCSSHSYLTCMIPVAISNIYTLTCVSQTENHKMWLQSIKDDAFEGSKETKWSCHMM